MSGLTPERQDYHVGKCMQAAELDGRNAEARAILEYGLSIGIPGSLRAFIEQRLSERAGGA